MSRYREDKKRWEASVKIDGRRVRTMFDTQEEADAYEADAKLAIKQGRPIVRIKGSKPSTVLTLHQLKSEVEKNHWAGQKSEEGAVYNAERVVKEIGPTKPIDSIRVPEIDKLVRNLKAAGLKPATINRKLSALRTMLNYAHKREWVASVPAITWQKEPAGRCRVFTADEETAMRTYFLEHGERDMDDLVVFLFETGARLGEALKIEGKDVVDGSVKFIDTKNGKDRHVPLTEMCKAMLKARGVTSGPVFNLTGNMAEHRWKAMRDSLGKDKDPEFIIHSIRHTNASRLVSLGVDLYQVQLLLGHSTPKVTQRYAHMSKDRLAEATAALNRMRNPIPSAGAGEGTATPAGVNTRATTLRLVS